MGQLASPWNALPFIPSYGPPGSASTTRKLAAEDDGDEVEFPFATELVSSSEHIDATLPLLGDFGEFKKTRRLPAARITTVATMSSYPQSSHRPTLKLS